MHKKSLNIGTQLQVGFAIMLAFVILLGMVSYIQTQRLQLQTKTIFNHPFQVSKSIATIELEIQKMVIASRDLASSTSEKSRIHSLQELEAFSAAVIRQFDLVESKYLGPRINVEEAYNAFLNWRILMEEHAGKTKFSKTVVNETERISENAAREELISKLDHIDAFATNKANQTFELSQKIAKVLNRQLLFLIIVILVLSIIVNTILLRNIRKPLRILTDATHRFRHGDMNARSSYPIKNEFGILSDSFNKLAHRIQQDVDLSDKKASLSASMLSENDTRAFFQSTLTSLLKLTDSQMAAIYLVADDQKTLELYESIGLNDNLRKTFDLSRFEGEVGAAISTHKVQHIKTLKKDEPFVFETVCGSIKPREIITMPLLSGDKIIATIHLANINSYDVQSILLVESTLDTLNARVVGILASQKIRAFSEMLEVQNRELEMQKTELFKQSAT
ncbi:MAG: HAMP domain-containing protein, partial [Bacteroidia bacterium]|nr:HAMP domain-containing protein [Bacteroidia bacterium]